MANRYWVGGTEIWNGTATGKWSTTSGGASGAAIPTSADDVFLDAASGAVTVNIRGARVCRSFTTTGFTGTVTSSTTPSLTIGDASGGAMTLGATMTIGTFPPLTFASTSNNGGAGWPVTTGGHAVSTTAFDGVGGKWVLQDTFSTGAFNNVSLVNGTLDTNNQTLNVHQFDSSNSNTRTLTLGTSTVNCALTFSAGNFWDVSNTTNLTFSGANATIELTGYTTLIRTFAGGGLTYGTLRYTQAALPSQIVVTGNNTFNTINVGPACGIAFAEGSGNNVTNWNVSGQPYEYLRSAAFNSTGYISTNDSAALSVTGDITLLIRIALDNWAPFPAQMFMGKRVVAGDQRSYHWNISLSGFMQFVVSSDGVSTVASTADAATGFANGTTNWVLVSRRASDGRVQFFKADGSILDPVASDFTQIGTDQAGSAGAIFDGTAPLEICSTDFGTTQPATANVYRAKVYDGLFSTSAFGGTLQYDADFTKKTFGSDAFAESSANAATVSLNGTATYGDGRVHIASTVPGFHQLTKIGVTPVTSDYLVLLGSLAFGAAPWYAGGHSVNLGGNVGWIFQTYGDGRFLNMF